ncbi:unnamed protein product [Miscanthus lutarioriparius]|uniref:Uncharacterized protein n=1 Tax=Miscanthus lutarioriparius TaxID=422564 RepID=A0A811PZ88_9POAL|nr:unnamed protein product [Miscanthus lutarioriparius]
MDPAGPRVVTDPAGSGAAPPREELDGRGGGGACSGAAAAEGSASRLAGAGLGDPRAGFLESLGQAEAYLHPYTMDVPQLTAEGATQCGDRVSLLPQTGALQSETPCLTLGRDSNAALMEKLHGNESLPCGKENIGTDLQPKPDPEHVDNKMSVARLGLDLNTVDSSDAADLNPFFPYKKLGQSKVSDPSECGSTTGATEESESHRKWREMKQNGFLSSSHGSAMVPRPHGRASKRKRDDEFKKSTSTQHGQANKSMKVAAPSGLLSGLNPGIINHVRNSKQDGDSLKLQLSSAVTMFSDRTCSTSADDPASNHDYMTVLSVKAASVASQWLELLHQDIRGRLAALKRSRKRVRNALHTELPYLILTEFPSNQENESSIANTSEAGCTDKAVSEEHMARWRSLFVQMDRALQEEGKQLEKRLKQVQEMQLNCDKGLKHMTCESPLLGPMAELWKLKNPDISESEWAVQAAAASIYSTCNMVMRAENNVPCF